MISTLRTYRTLPVLFAMLLMASIGLPALCLACGLSDASGHMGASTAVHDMQGTMAHCGHGLASEHPMPDADAPSMPSHCEVGACTVEADVYPPVVYTERITLRLGDDTADIIRAPEVRETTPVRWVIPWENESIAGRHDVPVRLLTSSFLL